MTRRKRSLDDELQRQYREGEQRRASLNLEEVFPASPLTPQQHGNGVKWSAAGQVSFRQLLAVGAICGSVIGTGFLSRPPATTPGDQSVVQAVTRLEQAMTAFSESQKKLLTKIDTIIDTDAESPQIEVTAKPKSKPRAKSKPRETSFDMIHADQTQRYLSPVPVQFNQ